MDPYTPMIDESVFHSNDYSVKFYRDTVEEDPPQIPYPLGEPVLTSTFLNGDHASNVVTRRSHIGILLFVYNGIIKVFRKRQNTFESSTFGSELVTPRIDRYLIVEVRLKMKSIVVLLKGPTHVYCDNQGVMNNTRVTESTLNKKHNSINYHVVREAATDGILRVEKEDTGTNLADPLKKLMPYS